MAALQGAGFSASDYIHCSKASWRQKWIQPFLPGFEKIADAIPLTIKNVKKQEMISLFLQNLL
jgi:hypothetical protein